MKQTLKYLGGLVGSAIAFFMILFFGGWFISICCKAFMAGWRMA